MNKQACLYEKQNMKILKRIPKGASVSAAHNLANVIYKCVKKNDIKSWCDLLLFFSYAAFQIPEKKLKSSSLTRINSKEKYQWSKRVESKISEGDVRGAVKLLVSTDGLADQNITTFQKLQEEHPSPGRHLNFLEPPDTSITASAPTMDVYDSTYSFPNGSASGIDGIRLLWKI